MINCNLSKPEATLEAVRKARPELAVTDAALLATAIVEAGRWAVSTYDGASYDWTTENQGPMKQAVLREVRQVQEVLEGGEVKKKTKVAKTESEEPVTVTLPLRASQEVGEKWLADRGDLKTLLSDLLNEGVEYQFGPTDIAWHWSMERVNWNTATGGDIARRIRFTVAFDGNCEAVEVGSVGKRRTKKKS